MVTNCDLKRYFYLFDIEVVIEAFALTRRILITIRPRALPWAESFWTFSPFLNHLQKIRKNLYPRRAL